MKPSAVLKKFFNKGRGEIDWVPEKLFVIQFILERWISVFLLMFERSGRQADGGTEKQQKKQNRQQRFFGGLE